MDSNATLSAEGPSPVHLSPCRSPIRRRVSHPSGHFQNATFPELKPTLGICLHQGFITVEAFASPQRGAGTTTATSSSSNLQLCSCLAPLPLTIPERSMHILVNRHLEEGGSALASAQRLCSAAPVQRSVCEAQRLCSGACLASSQSGIFPRNCRVRRGGLEAAASKGPVMGPISTVGLAPEFTVLI